MWHVIKAIHNRVNVLQQFMKGKCITWTDTLHQFIKGRNFLNTIFVILGLHKRPTWMDTMLLFMKERSLSNVKFAMLISPKILQKHHLNEHIASIHKGKKPFECKLCTKRKLEWTITWQPISFSSWREETFSVQYLWRKYKIILVGKVSARWRR